MNEQERIVSELQRYVEQQVALIAALQASRAPNDGSIAWFADLPKTGEVTVRSQRWRFMRHGGGILFSEASSGRKIDVHDEVDQPEVFDQWRLNVYFGSLRRTGAKILERSTGRRGISVQDALEVLLPQLREAGAILERNGAFVLAPRCRQATSQR